MNLLLSDPAFLSVAAGGGGPSDPYFSNVSLLLHGDGTNGSTTIVDSSPSPKTVTAVDNAQISTAVADPFGNSTGVIAFDGTDDYLTIASNSDLTLGDTWTTEWWHRLDTAAIRGTFVSTSTLNTAGHMAIYIEYSGQPNNIPTIRARIGTSGNDIDATSGSLVRGQWQHCAVCSSSNSVKIFLDGILQGSGTAQSTPSNPISSIGRFANLTGYDLDGYISNLRITKGVARYTTNFTPPTAPFPDI